MSLSVLKKKKTARGMFLYYSSSKTLVCLPVTAANILLAKAVKKVSTKSAGQRNMLLPQQKMLPIPRATRVDRGKSRWLDEITAWSNLNWPNVQTSDWYFSVNFINLFTWMGKSGNLRGSYFIQSPNIENFR